MEDIYINKQLKLVMSGFMLEKPDVGHIGRANADEIFVGEPKHTQRVTLVVEDGGYIPVVKKITEVTPLTVSKYQANG